MIGSEHEPRWFTFAVQQAICTQVLEAYDAALQRRSEWVPEMPTHERALKDAITASCLEGIAFAGRFLITDPTVALRFANELEERRVPEFVRK